MTPRTRLRMVAITTGLALFFGLCGTARGQGELIGQRGGLIAPATPGLPSILPGNIGPTTPPSQIVSDILKGLQTSGTQVQHGLGPIVSDLTHQGVHGQQLADVIHMLKPYRQKGTVVAPTTLPGLDDLNIPRLGMPLRGLGKGKGGR